MYKEKNNILKLNHNGIWSLMFLISMINSNIYFLPKDMVKLATKNFEQAGLDGDLALIMTRIVAIISLFIFSGFTSWFYRFLISFIVIENRKYSLGISFQLLLFGMLPQTCYLFLNYLLTGRATITTIESLVFTIISVIIYAILLYAFKIVASQSKLFVFVIIILILNFILKLI
jgi:hypothetical protein